MPFNSSAQLYYFSAAPAVYGLDSVTSRLTYEAGEKDFFNRHLFSSAADWPNHPFSRDPADGVTYVDTY